ncbi:MAG: hypothetical protein CM15mP47_1170 [Methanobacteriota archaeon]|nr:MAG: hypothetical protein CM15mP47_1170 [Euryarchaeota archaeon]
MDPTGKIRESFSTGERSVSLISLIRESPLGPLWITNISSQGNDWCGTSYLDGAPVVVVEWRHKENK